MTFELTLKPHIERGGYHLDRFDAYLDGELIVTSRQPLYDGARKLLDRGFAPTELLSIHHAGKDYDSFEPAPIGELAKWTIAESDRGGLQRQRWKPFDAARLHDVAPPASDDVVPAGVVPLAA
jgi:hypothetical protein